MNGVIDEVKGDRFQVGDGIDEASHVTASPEEDKELFKSPVQLRGSQEGTTGSARSDDGFCTKCRHTLANRKTPKGPVSGGKGLESLNLTMPWAMPT